MEIKTVAEAKAALVKTFPSVVKECRNVLGSELHYQAILYHCLRAYGEVPIGQLGMNVKIWIHDVATELFVAKDARKEQKYRGGFEPIPDIVLFEPDISGDWRRRNYHNTFEKMLYTLEIKASERKGNRLTFGEIKGDIDKQIALRGERRMRLDKELGVGVIIIDTAPDKKEVIRAEALAQLIDYSQKMKVDFGYFSLEKEIAFLK